MTLNFDLCGSRCEFFREMSPAKKTSLTSVLRLLAQKSSGELDALQVLLKERKPCSPKTKKPTISELEPQETPRPKKQAKPKVRKTSFVAPLEWEGRGPEEGDVKFNEVRCFADLLTVPSSLPKEYQKACAPNFDILVNLLFKVLGKGLTVFALKGEERNFYLPKGDIMITSNTIKETIAFELRALSSETDVKTILEVMPLPWTIELLFWDSEGNFQLKTPEERDPVRVTGTLPNGDEVDFRLSLFQSSGGKPQSLSLDLAIPKA